MVDVNVDFIFENEEPINADFQLEPDVTYTADIMLSSASSFHNDLYNRDLPDQHPIGAITGLEGALGDLETAISDEETRAKAVEDILAGGILDEETRAKGEEQELAGGIDSNHQAISNHVSDKNNPHEVTKAQVGLGNVENLAPADMPMSTATKTYVDNADNGLQGQITTINTTIGGYGNIVTHNVSEFATASQGSLADTALQPSDNISELTNNLNYQTATQVANSIAVETNNRESADNNLQSQIDAIVSASDVFDIVGTYAELQAYDISTVPVNDIIKVLEDSTHGGAATYYRCVETGGVKSWLYIGSEGAYYTKGEADSKFVPLTRTVNSKALSSDITLTASDVGALPDSTVIPTVNDATVTIQKNGSTVSTFTLNQSSNETVNITVPTDTGDLTNGAGFITGITSGDVTTALGYTPANSASLATVATSGSYNDLSNKPTIPTVNDGQLDIQVNGSSIATFTANQSGNTTADITIPSSLPDQTGNEGKFLTTDGTDASWKYVMNYIGTYSGTTQYHPGDIVRNYVQGSYHKYLCKKDALGQYPDVTNDYWQDLTGYVSGLYQYSNDYPLISYSVDGWSGNTAKSVRLIVPQTSAAVSNIPTVNTYSGLLKVPGGIDGYSPDSAFGAVAFSNDYTDLDNKPTIPAAQVNSDWNANSGVAEILNKPTLGTMASENASDYTPTSSLATVATSGLYSDLSGTPTIPTVDQVYDGTSANAQSGIAVASAISTKQDSATALTTTNTYYSGNTLYIG